MSFRTPLLIDVPRDLSKRRISIKAFKEKSGIETHDTQDPTDPYRWVAVLMGPCRKFGYGVTETSDIFDLYAKVGRLMDEAEYTAYAASERQAIKWLCEQNKIECPL